MIFRLSDAMANALLDSGLVAANIDGFVLEIRDGVIPANANTAPTGTVLDSITLPSTGGGGALNAAGARAKTKKGTWANPGAAAGSATWARIRSTSDLGTTNTTDKRMDFDVTASGGGGAITLDNVVIAPAQPVTVTSAAFGL